MIGALLQLNAVQDQDIFLSGKNDDASRFNFIKQAYKLYHNFALEETNILPNETVDFGKIISIDIKPLGDFLFKTHFTFSLPSLTPESGTWAGWTNSIGHSIIEWYSLEINGNEICRDYGLFMEIWYELTNPQTTRNNQLIGKYIHTRSLKSNALSNTEYRVPLNFWFNKNIGASLPLVSLYSSKVRIIIQLNSFDNCIIYDGNTPPKKVNISEVSLTAQYIFVDDNLRKQMRDTLHTYIIEQVQASAPIYIGNTNLIKTRLDFNHPVKELFFILREIESEQNNDWFNFGVRNTSIGTRIDHLLQEAKLEIEGKDRTVYKNAVSLSLLNNSIYHSNISDKYIYTMQFCSDPEKWIPTGSLNFSSSTDISLSLKLTPGYSSHLHVFVKNYNWVVITEGFASLAYKS